MLVGLTTGLGGTARLAHLVGRAATAEMVLDCAPVSARRLQELGAVHRVVEDGRCVEVALAWAERLAQRPAAALAAQKQALAACEQLPLDQALAEEQRRFQANARTPEAIERMAEAQARYDAGTDPAELFGEPFEA